MILVDRKHNDSVNLGLSGDIMLEQSGKTINRKYYDKATWTQSSKYHWYLIFKSKHKVILSKHFDNFQELLSSLTETRLISSSSVPHNLIIKRYIPWFLTVQKLLLDVLLSMYLTLWTIDTVRIYRHKCINPSSLNLYLHRNFSIGLIGFNLWHASQWIRYRFLLCFSIGYYKQTKKTRCFTRGL